MIVLWGEPTEARETYIAPVAFQSMGVSVCRYVYIYTRRCVHRAKKNCTHPGILHSWLLQIQTMSVFCCFLAACHEGGVQHLAALAEGVPAGCSLPGTPPVNSPLAGPAPYRPPPQEDSLALSTLSSLAALPGQTQGPLSAGRSSHRRELVL